MTYAIENNYVFIDSQNLNLGVRSMGWKIDYRKLRLYLKNKYNVSKAFMFIGYLPKYQSLYADLEKAGFSLVFKQVVSHHENGKVMTKGNVDAELVLHTAAIEYENYDKAIIVSNDGDFACLIAFLVEHNKLKKILAPNTKYSTLLKPYLREIVTLDRLKHQLKIADIGGRSKP